KAASNEYTSAISKSDTINVQLIQTGSDTQSSAYIMPVAAGASGYLENAVSVKNAGNVDVYVRIQVAIPSNLDEIVYIVENANSGWTQATVLTDQDCNGVKSNIYTYVYDNVLNSEEQTAKPALLGFRLDEKVDGEVCTIGNVTYDLSKGVPVSLFAQGVQSEYWETSAEAFAGSGLPVNPWAAATEGPMDQAQLTDALSNFSLVDGSKVYIRTNVTEVIFGKKADYVELMTTCHGRPLDMTDGNGPWVYYEPTTTENNDVTTSTWKVYILSDAVLKLPANCKDLFKDMKSLVTVNTSNLDTSSVTQMEAMFMGCAVLTTLDVSNWDTSNVTSMHNMFNGCTNLDGLDVSKWDTSNVKRMSQMFYQCSNITTLDVSKWDVSKVISLSQMFNGCSKLVELETSEWELNSNTDSFNYMFANCSALTKVDVDGWVTSNTKSISFMFLNCKSLTTIDVSNWNTSNVTAMDNAFNGCSSVTALDVSKWDTSKVTTMWQMFQNCAQVTQLDVSGWDTSNVTNMANMFNGCKTLTTLDLSNFVVTNVEKVATMFSNCSELTTIFVSANGGWDLLAQKYANEIMFASCKKLVGGVGTTYSSQYGAYAIIDGGASKPGYFTVKPQG
ncbi:MAG: BspA family leucine-rich repeat surface protein, partial [Clostridia bacterium]|nr:BspA family leucine-rich repeat surface protein [Clostridia bacterium]